MAGMFTEPVSGKDSVSPHNPSCHSSCQGEILALASCPEQPPDASPIPALGLLIQRISPKTLEVELRRAG